MVLANGREVSMKKFSVEERSRVPLNACIVVHGNEIIHCRNHLEIGMSSRVCDQTVSTETKDRI